MKYSQFREKVSDYPFFRSNIFEHITDNVPLLRRQITEWVKKGYVLQLKRGFYTLAAADRKVDFSRYFLANQLYQPSYISSESALSYYGLIPEAVYAITSITSKKTQNFDNVLGHFTYQHIKPDVFTGFITEKDEFGNNILIATKEKAVVDFLYLKTRGIKTLDESIFESSFRFQNTDLLEKKQLRNYAEQFSKKKLIDLVKKL